MASEARSGRGTLRTVALAYGSGTAEHRPRIYRCGPPTAAHSPLGAAVGGGAIAADCRRATSINPSPTTYAPAVARRCSACCHVPCVSVRPHPLCQRFR